MWSLKRGGAGPSVYGVVAAPYLGICASAQHPHDIAWPPSGCFKHCRVAPQLCVTTALSGQMQLFVLLSTTVGAECLCFRPASQTKLHWRKSKQGVEHNTASRSTAQPLKRCVLSLLRVSDSSSSHKDQRESCTSTYIPSTTMSLPRTPTASVPFLTASSAYSTWNLQNTG